MALEMQVLVEHPISRKRYVVEAIVGVDDEECPFPCFECEATPTRPVRIRPLMVWRSQNKDKVMPSVLSWMEAVYQAEERLGDGRPVCMKCWDEVVAPKLWYLAKMP